MKANKTLERLNRRKEWLEKRISENKEKDLSYDKAELNALKDAISRIKETLNDESS